MTEDKCHPDEGPRPPEDVGQEDSTATSSGTIFRPTPADTPDSSTRTSTQGTGIRNGSYRRNGPRKVAFGHHFTAPGGTKYRIMSPD